MQIPGMKFQEPKHSPYQPTLPLEVFLEETGTPPGGTPETQRTSTTDMGVSRTCEPSEVWETLAKADREKIKSSWTRTMREVADDACDE